MHAMTSRRPASFRKKAATDLAVRYDLPMSLVGALIRDIFAALGDELVRSGRVSVRHFGVWEIVPARSANLRDPRTGLPCPPTSPVDIRFASAFGLAERCGALRCRHRPKLVAARRKPRPGPTAHARGGTRPCP